MTTTTTSRARRGAIWGMLLIVFGVLALVETVTDLSAWAWVGVLAAGGFLVLAAYAVDRTQPWLLVVSYAMLAVAGLVALLTLEVLRDPFIAPFVLGAIALPFVVAFFHTGATRWALLIPPYVLLAVAVMVPLEETGVLADNQVATYVLFSIAIPFFVAFARAPRRWWALVPGVILAIIGVSLLITERLAEFVGPIVLIIAGVLVLVRQLTRKEA
jgi:hypothetical protein